MTLEQILSEFDEKVLAEAGYTGRDRSFILKMMKVTFSKYQEELVAAIEDKRKSFDIPSDREYKPGDYHKVFNMALDQVIKLIKEKV